MVGCVKIEQKNMGMGIILFDMDGEMGRLKKQFMAVAGHGGQQQKQQQ